MVTWLHGCTGRLVSRQVDLAVRAVLAVRMRHAIPTSPSLRRSIAILDPDGGDSESASQGRPSAMEMMLLAVQGSNCPPGIRNELSLALSLGRLSIPSIIHVLIEGLSIKTMSYHRVVQNFRVHSMYIHRLERIPC